MVTDNVMDTGRHQRGSARVRHTSSNNVPPYASPNTHATIYAHTLTHITHSHAHLTHIYARTHLTKIHTRIHTEALRVRTHMDADVDYVIPRGLHPHHIGLSDTVQGPRLGSTAKHLLPREDNVGAGAWSRFVLSCSGGSRGGAIAHCARLEVS